MVKKTFYLFLAAVFVGCNSWNPVVAQPLWPGDVNNNGIVNAVDLVYLGQAFGVAGPPRAGASTEWLAQDVSTLWGQAFPNGVNYAYADCDGNGIIDINDLDSCIEDNFGRTHGALQPDGFSNGSSGSAPPAQLLPSATAVEPGAVVDIGLSLGSQNFPVSSFYGIAILFSYTPEFLDDDSFEFEFEGEGSGWIQGPKIEYFFHDDDDAPGKAQIAITRTDRQPQGPGFGEVGKFSIVIEDIIVGLEADTFRLQIDSILLVGEAFNTYAVVPDSTAVIITRDSALLGASSQGQEPHVKIYPNPTSGSFFLECPDKASSLHLADALGRAIPLSVRPMNSGFYEVNTSGAPPGLYWLLGRTDKGSFRKKIVIH
ncbi:MAG: T9SS type A sorting domain-containing protein [Phaeodactylibacter sp.]|nr:T9SS type A sorting domain-containing protein [Phaeodactylibacter sp.]MCB9050060.1 T9SS type A sorting domain-containing protein [Lewinellaceae bacterium]